MITNKRGISPLIATVLIVGFTIVLAVIVINFVLNTTTDQTEAQACQSEAQSLCLSFAGSDTFTVTRVSNIVTINNLAQPTTNFTISIVDATTGATLSGPRELGPIAFGSSLSTPASGVGSLAISTGNKIRVTPMSRVTVNGNVCQPVACTAATKEVIA